MTWETAAAGPRVVYVVLAELELTSGVVRVHDGVGTLTWAGEEWLGLGDFGAVSAITSGGDLSATAISLTMSGVPSEYRSDLLNASSRGDPARLYHGFVDDGGTWAHEPELAFEGAVDTSRLVDGTDDGEPSVSVTVNIVSAAAYARRFTLYRRSFAHQQTLYPGDRFYEFRTDLRNPVAGTADGLRRSAGAGAVTRSGSV